MIPDNKITLSNIQIRKKENKFKELLYKLHILKPKYNEYHTLEICENKKLVNHSYCQKFITKEITKTESEVIKILENFLKVHVDVITTAAPEKEKIDVKTIIKYSLIGILTIVVVVILLLIKKKRGEL